MVALHGLGGAGKTSVAVEYAHRHLAEVGLAWQFAAEDPAVLVAEFARLAAQLGARGMADSRDPVASVHAVLAAFAARWLLVLDNADGQEAVQRFLPPAGSGRVLITSQSAVWPRGRAVEVPPLGTGVAAAFLVNQTGDPDEQAATDLAGELGGLPLALEQAAAYILATGTTLARYLSLFRDRRADLLARGKVAGHPADVAATLGLALSRLNDEAPDAAGLLRLLAFLAPEPAPLDLVLPDAQTAGELAPDVAATIGPLLGDPVAAGDAVAALRRYSLVTSAGDGLLLVHRLVQALTRAQVPREVAGQWEQAAAALVEAAVPADPELPRVWPVCAVLLPHARAVLGLTSSGMSRVGRYLGRSGSYLSARDLFQLIANACSEDDAYGPEHPATLTARAHLARWTGEAGDPAGARDQLAELLPIRTRVLGPEHPATLATRSYLAHNTGLAGDPAGARDQLAELLPIRTRVLGPEHPDTLAARDNLARWTGEAGNAAVARDQYAELLPILERVLGPEHQDALTARRDVASWTGEAGDLAAARDQYAALLPVFERVLGPEHPDTLATQNALAAWTGEAGNATGARDLLAALLPERGRALGWEYPDTLLTRHLLASWTGEAGDQAAARDQYTELLPVFVRVLGPDHPDTLIVRRHLAYWTGEAGDPAAARDQYTELLPVLVRVLGPDHPETLMGSVNLADWTGRAGDPAAARDQLAALLRERVRVLGREHPDTLTARKYLAEWTGNAGDLAGARDMLVALVPDATRALVREHPVPFSPAPISPTGPGRLGIRPPPGTSTPSCCPVEERVLGPKHPDVLIGRSQFARFIGEAGDPAGACAAYDELVSVDTRVFGPEHPGTLTARANLAYWTGETRGCGRRP